MEETRNIDFSSLEIDEILSEIKHILQQGENSHIQLTIVKHRSTQQSLRENSNILNYTLTLQEPEERSLSRRPMLNSFVRPSSSSSAESMRTMMKMSNRMGSYVARHRDTDSRLMINEECNLKPHTIFQGQLQRGQIFYEQKQYEVAIDMFKNISQEALTTQQKALLNINIGNSYFRNKQYALAIETYEQQFPQENDQQRGQRCNNLGSCYAKLKKYEMSLKSYSQALKIYSKFPDIDCSNLLNNIGIIYMSVRMFGSAEKYFIDSIDERKLKSPANVDLLCFSYIKLAISQIEEGKCQQAIENLLIALNWAERGEGDLQLVLKSLATCCEKLKRWSEALEYYQKLSNSSKSQGFILEKVSRIHQNLGHQHEFQKFLKQAMAEYKKESNERKVSELNNIARSNGLAQVTI